MSFTRRAAREAVTRASEQFSLDPDRFTHFRTLHSECFRQLGLSPDDVLQGKILREFASWIGIELSSRVHFDEGSRLGLLEGDRILHIENLARVRCRPLREMYDEDDDDLPWSEVDRVQRGLETYKRHRHLLDYTDMLSHYATGRMRPRLRVLLVDEAQDLSLLQWQVVDRLSQGCERVVVAGDDDQTIYRWAGAALEHFVGMPGRARVLGQSYRVPVAVQTLALECIGQVQARRPKAWSPRAEEGRVERAGVLEEVDLGGRDVLVLARNNYILQDQVVPVLRREGIIYEHRGEMSVDPDILGAITTWERARRGEPVTVGEARLMLRWCRRGGRGLHGVADDSPWRAPSGMTIWHEGLDRLPTGEMSYLLAARRRGEGLQRKPRVRLSTIHGAKGAQAEHVVLLTEMAPRTQRDVERWPDDEARVWYVGLTRTSDRLTIVQSSGRHGREV